MMIHIVISVLTLGIWVSTIFKIKSDSSQGGLSGNCTYCTNWNIGIFTPICVLTI
jgi:hypothetical protein